MVKGTPAHGKKSGKRTHCICRRCGQRTFHMGKGRCASCGYGDSKRMRTYNWSKKR